MSCRVKRKISASEKVQKAVNQYNENITKQKQILTEAFIYNNGYNKKSTSLTETAIDSFRTRDMMYISYNSPKIVLFETSLYNQPTLDSVETIEKVIKVCGLQNDQVYGNIHYEDQKIADYICYYLPETWTKDKIDSTFEKIDKIMSACGYFLALEPEKTYNSELQIYEYTIQYEPNEPDWRKVTLPDELHHVTTVANSNEISQAGFIPKVNDIYKYSPRVYFVDTINNAVIIHLVRRHKNNLKNPKTNKLEYADITINTPNDVKFYIDCHMRDVDSFFTFDKIDKTYIKSIEIKEFSSMFNRLKDIQ